MSKPSYIGITKSGIYLLGADYKCHKEFPVRTGETGGERYLDGTLDLEELVQVYGLNKSLPIVIYPDSDFSPEMAPKPAVDAQGADSPLILITDDHLGLLTRFLNKHINVPFIGEQIESRMLKVGLKKMIISGLQWLKDKA